MFKHILTQAAPVSEPFMAGPYYDGDDFGTAYIRGAFGAGGAAVTLEACPISTSHEEYDADNDWFTVPDISVTEKGTVQPGVKAALFRWRVTDADGATSIIIRTLTKANGRDGLGV